MFTKNNFGFLTVRVAVAVTAIAVFGILIFLRGGLSLEGQPLLPVIPASEIPEFRKLVESDHVRGDSEAPITVIEFSDFECPFCARFHPVLDRLITENTDINWVYRHFPLATHENALTSAVASECVAEAAGNEAFWSYADSLFAAPRIDEELLVSLAEPLVEDMEAFTACREREDVAEGVRADLTEVTKLGGNATPSTVIVTPKGDYVMFAAALEYEELMEIIEFVREN